MQTKGIALKINDIVLNMDIEKIKQEMKLSKEDNIRSSKIIVLKIK